MLFCHVTSLVKTDPYPDLLTQKGGSAFPYVVLLDEKGDLLLKDIGARTVDPFKKMTAYVDVKRESEGGDAAATLDLALLDLDYGMAKREEGEARIKSLGELSEAQKKYLEEIRLNFDVEASLAGLGRDEAKKVAAGRTFAEGLKDGKVPTKPFVKFRFYSVLLDYAETEKDVPAAEKALEYFRAEIKGGKTAQWLEKHEEKLRQMKGAAKP